MLNVQSNPCNKTKSRRRISSIDRQRLRQPARPVVEPGIFVPPDCSTFVNIKPDAQVRLSCLCSKCKPVSRWLQANQPASKRRYSLRNYSVGSEIHSFKYYNNGAQLRRSYLDGCHLCTIIWRSILLSNGGVVPVANLEELMGFKISLRCKKPFPAESNIRLTLVTTWKTPGDKNAEHRPLSLSTWPPPFWALPGAEPIPFPSDEVPTCGFVSTSSKLFLDLASRWLQECDTSHKKCRAETSNGAWRPTRLIDVGSMDEATSPRVITMNEPGIGIPYLTLSYRWGWKNSDPITLTRFNKDSFAEGIVLHTLPKTIQDAIHVTRKLGFKWLWVDSLCIIQDDDEDRTREVNAMADVYSNCLLTIAALGASYSSDGLFSQRDPLSYSSCKLFESAEGSSMYAHPEKLWETFKYSFEQAPLHQRGWVLQERLLSPRTLNFGPVMVWECRHSYKDEFQLSHRTRHLTWKGRFLPQELGTDSILATTQASFYKFWSELLMLYTSAGLSIKSDRLVALNGAIRAIGKHTGWKNSAGLWHPFLLQELLWFCRKPTKQSSRLGPTWSWQSVDHPVVKSIYEYQPARYLASIADPINSSVVSRASENIETSLLIRLTCGLVSLTELISHLTSSLGFTILPDSVEKDDQGITQPFYPKSIVAAILENRERIYGLVLRKLDTEPITYQRLGVIYISLTVTGILAARIFDDAQKETILLA